MNTDNKETVSTTQEYLELDIPGWINPKLIVHKSPFCLCGERVGFRFGGGVLPQRDALELAEMIIDQLSLVKESEEKYYKGYFRRIQEESKSLDDKQLDKLKQKAAELKKLPFFKRIFPQIKNK